MRVTGLLAGLCAAACSGPAKPPVVEPVGEMRRPPAPVEPAMPAYGERDAEGRPHGAWLFDCDGSAMGCAAWFEHGTQVQWAKIGANNDRYIVDAIDGGWRWQYWTGNVLRAEGGLATQPIAWTPGEHLEFAYILPPQAGACAGPFVVRDLAGDVITRGTCEAARWVEWTDYDPEGQRSMVSHRSRDQRDFDNQTFDAAGQLIARTQLAGDAATDEAWFPSGQLMRRSFHDGVTSDSRVWYEDGTLAESYVGEHDDIALRRYAPDGTKIAEASWFGELKVGTWRTWYETGKRRTTVRFDRAGVPTGPLVVWGPDGKRVGEADLEGTSWTTGSKGGTRVVKARAPRGVARVELDGTRACKATDGKCLRELASMLFDTSCLRPVPDDPLTVWRGRIALTIGFDRNSGSGVVVAIRNAGGLPREYRDCLTARGARTGFAEELDIDVEVDLLTTSIPVPELRPGLDPMLFLD